MLVNAYSFTYKETAFNFNVKPVEDDLYKIEFLQPVGSYSLPQQFLLNTQYILVFLPEIPNAIFTTSTAGYSFLQLFAADLKKYMREFA